MQVDHSHEKPWVEKLLAIQRGDKNAARLWDDVMRELWPHAMNSARIFRSRRQFDGLGSTADDGAVHGLMRLYENIGYITDPDGVTAWLHVVIGNFFKTEANTKNKNEIPTDDPEKFDGAVHDDMPFLTETPELRRIIATLNKDAQDLLIARFVNEETYQTIAERLGVGPQTVRNRLATIYREIRLALKQAGHVG